MIIQDTMGVFNGRFSGYFRGIVRNTAMQDVPGYFMGIVWDTVCNRMGDVTNKMIWLGSQFVAVLIGRMNAHDINDP